MFVVAPFVASIALVSLAATANDDTESIGDKVKNTFNFNAGGAKSPVSGSASASGATGEAPSLEKCDAPMGTIAVA